MNKDEQAAFSSPLSQPELEGVEQPAIAWLQTLGYTHRSGKEVGHTDICRTMRTKAH